MPIYEYACDKCGLEFEREQRITDDPIKSCPECRGRKVRRLISRTSFVLKGGGWYSDLYSSAKPGAKESTQADDSAKEKGGADSEPKKSPEKSSEKKSGSTPPGKGKGKAKGPKAAA